MDYRFTCGKYIFKRGKRNKWIKRSRIYFHITTFTFNGNCCLLSMWYKAIFIHDINAIVICIIIRNFDFNFTEFTIRIPVWKILCTKILLMVANFYNVAFLFGITGDIIAKFTVFTIMLTSTNMASSIFSIWFFLMFRTQSRICVEFVNLGHIRSN